MNELKDSNFPVYAVSQSTTGAAPFVNPISVGTSVTLASDSDWPVIVKTGDIIMADVDGVIRVPIEMVTSVLEQCKILTEMDDCCMQAIKKGSTILDAFVKYRR
jgi:regulator of RNase E activity RraA